MSRPARTVLVLALALSAATGCAGAQRAQVETALAEALVSDAQESQLGLQVREQLEKEERIRYVTDPAITGHVQRLSAPILAAAAKDRPGVKWTVSVVDDPKQVNAFATPGGYLYVYTGLLLAAADDAEVAGVMGHEAGHVVGRHSARQMVNAMGLQTVLKIALGENPSGAAAVAAGLAGQGVLLAYGRGDELEADAFGVRYAAASGIDPSGIASFFDRLQAGQEKQPGFMTWLSTHPAHGDRIARVNGLVAKLESPPKGGRDAAALEKVKARIRALPPLPPREPKGSAQAGAQPGPPAPGSGPAEPTKQAPRK